jgi:hypothetical protein
MRSRKFKSTIANSPVKADEQGFNNGVIKSIDFVEHVTKNKQDRHADEIVYTACKMVVTTGGIVGDIDMIVYTGSKINPVPVDTKYATRGQKNIVNIYNKFTTLLLNLNIITVDDFETLSEKTLERVDSGLDKLINKKIKFKIVLNEKRLNTVDVGSIAFSK